MENNNKKIKNGLLCSTGVEKNIVCLWVCMINEHDFEITIDFQGCVLIFFPIRLVPLSCMKTKKMTS